MKDETMPIVAIVGPTASGKTGLAIKLAEKYRGEIICADSRTIYRGMDIGTAKPTADEQARVQHWGLDLVDPDEAYSAARFKEYAFEKIKDIRSRGKVPFIVGGTGLYVDAVLFDFNFGDKVEDQKRRQLEQKTIPELIKYCISNNIQLPENVHNKRYLIRAIERNNISGMWYKNTIHNSIVVGITTPKSVLRERIAGRFEQLLHNGVVEETMQIISQYGDDGEAMTGNVYRFICRYLDNEFDLSTLSQLATTADWRLAKRQMTWFRRNPHILWANLHDAEQYLSSSLSKIVQ